MPQYTNAEWIKEAYREQLSRLMKETYPNRKPAMSVISPITDRLAFYVYDNNELGIWVNDQTLVCIRMNYGDFLKLKGKQASVAVISV